MISYTQKRLDLRHQYNIGLLTYILETFETRFGQKLKYLERFRVVGEKENIKDIAQFCNYFYGVNDFEYTYFHFESGLKVGLTKNGQFFEIYYPGQRWLRTTNLEAIQNFINQNNII